MRGYTSFVRALGVSQIPILTLKQQGALGNPENDYKQKPAHTVVFTSSD
jgi:hypothetical protein